MTTTVALTLNGRPRSVAQGSTVAQLVTELGRGPAGIAVARNGEVVARSTWTTTELAEGDRLEILTAAQGG